ncbi:MAG TPA: hypothetical protein VLM19_01390, partial [Nitrospiraceae bacterium]|nr:hypothetical protein [Nitrospiraceae bacterium]
VSGPGSTPGGTRATVDGLHVQLDLLAAARTQREMTFTPPRNIFAPPQPDSSVATSASDPRIDPGTGELLLEQDVIAGMAQFHYLGFVRMEDGWREDGWRKKGQVAVLTKNDDLHVVKAGETVEEHVMVKTITEESVTLQDRRSHVEFTVLLS